MRKAREKSVQTKCAERIRIQVPFYHCDPLSVVWHGRYLEYFEQARMALFAKLDLDVSQICTLGYRMYVVDVQIRYMYPLRYGDSVDVRAWVTQSQPLIRIAYDLRLADGARRVARGYTVLATTDAEGALLNATPPSIVNRLEPSDHIKS